jgi:PAS domain S-box-containing protein
MVTVSSTIQSPMREKAAIAGSRNHYSVLPGTKCPVAGWSLVICALVIAASTPLSFATTARTKNVLVLYSFSDRKAQDDLEIIKSTTRSHVSAPVNFQVEYLESQLFETPGYEKGVTEALAGIYRGKKIDLVIAVYYPALRFAVEHREEIFPRAPIVFSSVATSRLEGQQPWPNVTGVTLNGDVRGTIDLALRLQPDAKNAAAVVGNAELDRYWLAIIHQELRLHESSLKVIDVRAPSPDQLLKGVSALPPHTIVLFQVIPEESAQPVLGTYDVLAAIAQRFQTYCFVKYCLDHGAVGGSYPDSVEQGRKAGELAARVLSGEKPASIPVVNGPPALAQVDWRQLRRWHIPESALPPGTIIWYRQQTAWARYTKYIVAGLVMILVPALLIIGLLWQRARSRTGDLRLIESEKRFRLMADTTPTLVWMCDKKGIITYLNPTRIDFTGQAPETGCGDIWSAFIHPDDLQTVLTANTRALEHKERFSREYRLRRRDGVYRWMLDVAAPRFNGDSLFAGFIGSAVDITEQKLAREALEKLGGKLLEAQEEERSRIARELHDDICQRLALLSLELEQASQGSNGSSASINPRLEQIRRDCVEIASDVQALSHKLHSSKLEYLGVVAAIRSFCREFSQQHNVSVDFTDETVSGFLPRDLSLTLFRVTQEALHNALKYSGVSRFSVSLRGTANEIRLEVSDEGSGFDVEEAMRDKGLGLVSMQERAHLVHGIFTIESRLNGGTRILLRAPLVSELIAATTAAGSA